MITPLNRSNRHCSREHHNSFPKKTRKRSRTIIHVKIQSSSHRINKNSNQNSSLSLATSKSHGYNQSKELTDSINILSSCPSLRASPDKNNTLVTHSHSCEIEVTKDHHRNLKKKTKKICTQRCIIFIIIIVLLLVIGVILTILIPILSKKKQVINIICPPLRWNSTGIMPINNSLISGSNSNQFNGPWDMVLDWSSTLYITDWANNRVQKYFMGAASGTTVAGQANGTAGSNSTDLYEPRGIVIDNDRTIYVADGANNRIQRWYKNASYGDTVAGITGSCSTSTKMFCGPMGLSFDQTSNTIYIADMNNHRIMSYQLGKPCCTVVAGGNGPGLNNNQLLSPMAVYFDSSSNSLFIANLGANNIVRWILGASNWILIAGNINGTNGTTSTRFASPNDVMLDPMGNMYVVDAFNYRVQFFPVGESIGTTIAGVTSQFGRNPTAFSGPRSSVLDNQLNLYVVDHWGNRILKFLRY